jgi:regulator of sirC expression with transglutaminase-like and TPR domain
MRSDADPRERFAELARRPDAEIGLAEGALWIAAESYPGLEVDAYAAKLDALAQSLRGEVENAPTPAAQVQRLVHALFRDGGFSGNRAYYYDPRNSYLNEVIDRRTGIPITMAIVYMEVGRRIGLPLEGVSFPGHFLVRVPMRRGMLVLDAFEGGLPQSEDELRERLKRVVPRGTTGRVPPEELPLDQFLEPATNRQILGRLLRNLKGIFREKDDPARLLEVLNRMLLVAPDAHAELRDRGLVYQRLECWRPALQDLRDYTEREPEAPDADEIRARVIELSRLCAKLN